MTAGTAPHHVHQHHTRRTATGGLALALAMVLSLGAVGSLAQSSAAAPAAPESECFGKTATIVGTPGDDVIRGTNGDDVIVAGRGDDRINARGGDDVICGRSGNDRIRGGGGDDRVRGWRGDDQIKGGSGADRLLGGLQADTILGGGGDDVLDGGAAVDECDGGPGTNTLTHCEVTPNEAPTDVTLAPTTVAENQPVGTAVGTLGAVDPDAGDTHTFTLVAGTGSGDNASFSISGSSLRTAAPLDHEVTPTLSIRVRATDSGGLSVERAFTVTVSDADDPPVAVDDTTTVVEEDPATAVDVLANDTDPDGGPKTVSSVTQPTHGTVAITGGGSGLTYKPNANYCNGGSPTDDFTYTLNGGDVGAVAATVTCVDDAAHAVDDTATVGEDSGATTITVLANDSDPESDPFSVTGVTQPANGGVTFTATDVSYTPDPDYCNSPPPFDTFTYTITGSDTATVSVTVTCSNDAPVAVDDTKNATEDTPLTFPAGDLTANDTDVDGDTLAVTGVSNPSGGTVAFDAPTMSITYTPIADMCGAVTFDYFVSDGTASDIGQVTVNIACVDDPPVANDDTATVAEDASATTINVLTNDTDAENDAITVTGVQQPADGTVTFTANDVSYTPDPDYCNGGSPTDDFTYTVNAGDTATVSVTVTCANDAPVVDLDTGAAGTGSSSTFNETNPHTGTGVLIAPDASVTDSDDTTIESATVVLTARPDGDAFESLSATIPGGSGITGGTYVPATGTMSFTGSASEADYTALIQSIRYDNTTNPPDPANRLITVVVNDGDVDSASSTATVQVVPLNVAPDLDLDTGTAGNDAAASFTEDGPAVVLAPNPAITDSDDADMEGATVVLTTRPDGNGNESLTFTIPGGSGITAGGGGYDPATGSVAFTGTSSKANYATLLGSVQYANSSDTPTTTARTVTFTVNDGLADSLVRTSTVSVTAADDPPVNTVPGAQSATEDTAKVITGMSVADPDDASLTVTLSVTNGTLTLAVTTGLSFTTGDGTADATMTFSGTKANLNTALASVTYDPTPNFNGTATLTLKSEDATLSDVDTVTVTVAAVNDAPVNSVPGAQAIDEDTPLFFTGGNAISVNDVDLEPLTVQVQVTHGTFTLSGTAGLTVSGNGTASVTLSGSIANLNAALNNAKYQGVADYNGPAQLTITTSDAGADSDLDTVAITVNPVNDAPSDAGESQNATGNTRLEVELTSGSSANPKRVSATGNLLDNATDVDDAPAVISVDTATVSDPPHGTVSVNSDGSYAYTPDAGYTGADSFTYQVQDDEGAHSSSQTVSITVATLIWYVRADAAAGGDGRSETPFNNLGGVETSSLAGSTVYVFRRTGDSGTVGIADNTFQLKANQVFLGSGVDLNDGGNLLYDGSAALRPSVGASVLLDDGNTVRSMAISGTPAAAPAIVGGAGDVGGTLDQLLITGSAGGISLNGTTGSFDVSELVVNTTGGTGISVVSAGTVNLISAGTISVTTAAGTGLNFAATATSGAIDSTTVTSGPSGIVVDDDSGSLVLNDVNISTTGTGLSVDSSNDVTVSGGDADITAGGTAVSLTTAGANPANPPDVTLDQVSSSGGGTGIAIDDIGAGTFSAVGGSLTGHSSAGIDINNGSGDITYGGTISEGAGSRPVEVTNRTGGTVDLNGQVSGTGLGISLTSNPNGTIRFDGGLTLSTGATPAFVATGGGIVVATQNNTSIVNTLTTTSGTPLNVANTTIGANGLTFRSIAANGALNGVVLTNTGSTAGLTISGNGGSCTSAVACTGGAILNTTSAVSLTNTRDVSIDRMFIQNTVGDGIDGTTTTNFSFTNGRIDNSGTGLGVETSNIGFNTTAAGTENNLSGVVTITGNTLTNAYYHGIDIFNFNGTISNATISNNTITSTTSTATSKGGGIRLVGFGSAGTIANITTATLNANTVTNFPSGSGIQVQTGNGNLGGGSPTGSYGSAGSPITLTNNIVSGQSAANRMATFALAATVNGKGTGFFTITGNTLSNTFGTTLVVSSFGFATTTATVANNTITANNAVGSQGIGAGTGAVAAFNETPTLNITVTGNTISQTDGNGILLVARDSAGTLNAGVRNNNVAAPLAGNRNGIRVDAGNSNSTDDAVCLNISGNTSAGSGLSPEGIGLRKQGTTTLTNDFGVEGMGATASPGVEAYVNGQNPAANGTLLISAASGFSNCSSAP